MDETEECISLHAKNMSAHPPFYPSKNLYLSHYNFDPATNCSGYSYKMQLIIYYQIARGYIYRTF